MKLSLLTVLLTTAITATGCAAESGSETETDGTTEALGVSVPNPSGAYFANVSANGSGCGQGTWNADISHDGRTLAIHFDAYSASVEPGQSMDVKDCLLSIDLKSPRGLSYAVTSMDFEGSVQLEAGMTARPTFSKYYFQGNPMPATESRANITGPFDDTYVAHDEILAADRVWSPCGTTRRLNSQTRIVLQNNAHRTGSGHVDIASASTSLRFGLAWRTC